VSASFGDKIAIAWNGSLAAAHAASAAMPYLSKAKSVEILTVGRANAEPIDAGDLERYLRLHGLTAKARAVDGTGRPISDVLLEAAVAGGAACSSRAAMATIAFAKCSLPESPVASPRGLTFLLPGSLTQEIIGHQHQYQRQEESQRRFRNAWHQEAANGNARQRSEQQGRQEYGV